jgi:Mn2+/Fe2+ NRAMP family transporter
VRPRSSFALGVIGTGLLAVPVLAGSAAYAIGEARKWPVGLARQPLQAKAFYATITRRSVGCGLACPAKSRRTRWKTLAAGR